MKLPPARLLRDLAANRIRKALRIKLKDEIVWPGSALFPVFPHPRFKVKPSIKRNKFPEQFGTDLDFSLDNLQSQASYIYN